MSVSLTNNGLVMPASRDVSSDANTLDDYEEGVYQYTLVGSTSGSMTIRTGYRYFSYTFVGQLCFVGGKGETQGTHTATGTLHWSLPVTARNLSDTSNSGAGSIYLYRTGFANLYNPTFLVSENNNFATVYYNSISNNEVYTLQGGNVDSAIEFSVGVCFVQDHT